MSDQPLKTIPDTDKKPPKLLKKTLDAMKLVEAGIPAKEALQAVNMVTRISPQAVAKFKAKVRKWSLTEPATVHLASKQVQRILRAKAREVPQTKVLSDGKVVEYTERITPTDTNILAAAGMVYDRYQPVIQHNVNVNVNLMDLHPVDISRFLRKDDEDEVG